MQYTPHIRLPLFESADKPTWLYDWNETMTKLDDVIYEINSSDIPAEVAELIARVNALERTVSQHTTDITTLQDQATSILGDINQIMSIIPASASPTNKLATMADIPGGSTPGIPIASATQLGGIKVGTGFTVDPTTGVANVTPAGGGGSSVSVVNFADTLTYVYAEPDYSAFVRLPLDGKPIGMTINMAHTFIFDADIVSQLTPPIIYSENNIHGGEIVYSLAKDGDDWYLEVFGDATEPATDSYQVYVMLSKASQTPTPPSGGEVITITDPQITSGASTLNSETLSITDVTPLS